MINASGGQPSIRAIVLDGEELHACPVDPAGEKRAAQ